MDRSSKEELVSELQQIFQQAGLVIVTQQTGMTVAQSSDLRVRARDANCAFKVTKNTLTKLALKDTVYGYLEDSFQGPTAVLWSVDAIAAAKVATSYAKENEQLKIVAGGMGQQSLQAKDIEALAQLPSLDELRGKLIGLLQAPATKVAGVIQAPSGQLARVVGAYSSKDVAA